MRSYLLEIWFQYNNIAYIEINIIILCCHHWWTKYERVFNNNKASDGEEVEIEEHRLLCIIVILSLLNDPFRGTGNGRFASQMTPAETLRRIRR